MSAAANTGADAAFGLIAKGNTARAHGWTVTSDFEGGHGEHIAITSQRAAYERTSDALRQLSDGNQIFVQSDHPRFRHSLIYVAAERTGMAGHLYKLNTILPAPVCYERAVAVLERYLEALVHHHPG